MEKLDRDKESGLPGFFRPTKIKLLFVLEWSLFALIIAIQGELESGRQLLVVLYPMVFLYLVGCVLAALCLRYRQLAPGGLLILFGIGLASFDQVVKLIVGNTIPFQGRVALVPGWLGLAHERNLHGSWLVSNFAFLNETVVYILQWSLAILVLLLAILSHRFYISRHRKSLWADVAFLGIFSGYVSWTVDMSLRGYILDYIDLPGLVTADLKDIYLTIGVAAFLAEVIERPKDFGYWRTEEEITMTQLQVEGVKLSYESAGQGEALVFIHGLGSSGADWELQIGPFSKQYQVVTFDVRGHGRSDKPPGPYRIAQFAEDTAALIEALKLAPAAIVGVSMGGMIGLQLVLDRPELVKCLVVVNSGSEVVPRTLRERWQALQRFLIVRLLGMRKMGQVLSQRLLPKPEHEELRRLFVERWAQNDQRAYIESMKAIVGWNVTDRLGEIDKPVLVLAADQDYTSLETKQAMVSRIKGAQLQVIEDCRHAMPVERPDEFNQALLSFLEKVG